MPHGSSAISSYPPLALPLYPQHVVDLLMTQCRKQRAKVRVAGTLSERSEEGCVLSPYLFNILAEMVMRRH